MGPITIEIFGGFNSVVSKMQQIALFFSDPQLTWIIIAFFVVGTLGAGIMDVMNGMRQGKSSLFAGLITCVIGLVLLKVFVMNNGTLAVYDRTTNKHAIVANVPDGIRLMYKAFNLVENFWVERWYTASSHPAIDYRDSANAIGFDLFLNSSKSGGIPNDPLIIKSIANYWDKCITFALNNPSVYNLTLAELSHGTAPGGLLASFGKAQNTWVRDVMFYQTGTTHQGGTRMTCRDVWDNLRPYLTNPANFSRSRDRICSASGFDINDATQVQACEQKLTHHLDFISHGQVGGGMGHFNGMMALARGTWEITKLGGDWAINRFIQQDFTIKGIGAIMGSTGYMGEARYAMFAIVGAITCVLLLLWPTPIFGKAFAGIIYLWGFIFFWAIGDAIAHKIAVDRAFELYAELRSTGGNIGINTLFHIPSETAKALGVFGQLRAYSMLVATIITGYLFKTSSPGMAQLGSRIGGAMSDIGQSAAERIMTPGGAERTLQENITPRVSTMANMPGGAGEAWDKFNQAERDSLANTTGKNLQLGANAKAAVEAGLIPDSGNDIQNQMNLGGRQNATTNMITPDGAPVTLIANEDGSKSSQKLDGSSGGYDSLNVSNPTIGMDVNQTVQGNIRDQYTDAQRNTRQSANEFVQSVDQVSGNARAFMTKAHESGLISKDQINQWQEGEDQRTQKVDDIVDRVSKELGLSENQKQAFANELYFRGEAEAKVGVKAPSFSPIQGGVEGRTTLGASNKDTHETAVSRALSEVSADEWKTLHGITESQHAQLTQTQALADSEGNGELREASEQLNASRSQAEQASQRYSEAQMREQTYAKAHDVVTSEGHTTRENVDAMVINALREQGHDDNSISSLYTYANNTANPALRDAARAEIRAAVSTVTDNLTQQTVDDARKTIDKGRDNLTSVDGTLKEQIPTRVGGFDSQQWEGHWNTAGAQQQALQREYAALQAEQPRTFNQLRDSLFGQQYNAAQERILQEFVNQHGVDPLTRPGQESFELFQRLNDEGNLTPGSTAARMTNITFGKGNADRVRNLANRVPGIGENPEE